VLEKVREETKEERTVPSTGSLLVYPRHILVHLYPPSCPVILWVLPAMLLCLINPLYNILSCSFCYLLVFSCISFSYSLLWYILHYNIPFYSLVFFLWFLLCFLILPCLPFFLLCLLSFYPLFSFLYFLYFILSSSFFPLLRFLPSVIFPSRLFCHRLTLE